MPGPIQPTPDYVPSDITPQGDPPPAKDNVQARIDELTAQLRETQRQAMAAAELNQQLLADRLREQNKPQAQSAPNFEVTLPEGTDPSLAAALKAQAEAFNKALAAQSAEFKQTLQAVQGQVAGSIDQVQFRQEIAQVPQNVADLANKLIQDWRAQGYTGWQSKDAIDHAYGILARQGKLAPVTQQAPATRQVDPSTGRFTASVPDPRGTQMLPDALPDEVLAKMDSKAQLAYWEDRMNKTGGVNQPITY